MSAKTVLHIQGRDEGEPRVVELDGRAIRIGRGRRCEVQLVGHRLSDVMCTLKQTSEGWLLQPQASSAMMSIYGEPIGRARVWEKDVPLRIDDYWLTLREVETRVGTFDAPIVVEPDLEEEFQGVAGPSRVGLVDLMAASVIDVEVVESRVISQPEPAREQPGRGEDLEREAARLRDWADRLAEQERQIKEAARERERNWEARRRAAVDRLRRSTRPVEEPTPTSDARRPLPRVPRTTSDLIRPAPSARTEPRAYPRDLRHPRLLTTPVARPEFAPESPVEEPSVAPLPVFEVEPTPPPMPAPEPEPPFLEPVTIEVSVVEPEPIAVVVPIVAAEALELDATRFEAFISETAPASVEVHRSATGLLDWDDTPEPEVVSGFEEPFAPLPPPAPVPAPAPTPPPTVQAPPTPPPAPAPAAAEIQEHPRHAEVPPRPHARIAAGAPLIPERPFGVDPAAMKARIDAEDSSARFPTAKAILDAQRRRVVAEPLKPRRHASGPRPTECRAPDAWNAPFWLAMIPALVVTLGVGGASVGLSALWAIDAEASNQAFAAAVRAENEPARALDPTVRPSRAWYRATATQLAAWALAVERTGDGPEAAAEAGELLDAARRVSPIHPAVRYAAAQVATDGNPVAALGLARDPASLALTARLLRKSGKTADAVRLYRAALELAANARGELADTPSFDEDPQFRRFRLPEESAARSILTELAEFTDWPYAEWSAALPPIASVKLAAARILKVKGSPDADAAFDAVLAVTDPPASGLASHLAARGEALAFRNRTDEAVESYKKGIEAAENERRLRLYSYNLAEILRSSSRDGERAALLRASIGEDPGEEITRRALEAQAISGLTADAGASTPATEPTRDPAVIPTSGSSREEPNLRRGAN